MNICNDFLQAISNIEYGGPLATTVHHSTPYILDTTPPQLNDVIITEYDTSTNQLVFSYNARYVETLCIQWNLSNLGTLGTKGSVLISKVS